MSSTLGVAVLNDHIYAVGGAGSSPDYHNSVESYSEAGGWVMENTMTLNEHTYSHCSAAIGTELFIIGGKTGSGSGSDSVQSFSVGIGDRWDTKKSLSIARYGHACTTASFGNKEGIFISGGFSSDSEYLDSVQFYTASDDIWEDLGELMTKRSYHSMSIVGIHLVVAGGAPEICEFLLF